VVTPYFSIALRMPGSERGRIGSRAFTDGCANAGVIPLLTPHWLRSKWCFAEVVQARSAGKTLVPVKIAECDTSGVLADIQQIDLTRDPGEGYRRRDAALREVSPGTRCVAPIRVSRVLTGHHDDIEALAFDRRGHRLASAGIDGTVCLWDLEHPDQAPQVLRGLGSRIEQLAFDPSEKRLAVAGRDGLMTLWELTELEPVPVVLEGRMGPSIENRGPARSPIGWGRTMIRIVVDGSLLPQPEERAIRQPYRRFRMLHKEAQQVSWHARGYQHMGHSIAIYDSLPLCLADPGLKKPMGARHPLRVIRDEGVDMLAHDNLRAECGQRPKQTRIAQYNCMLAGLFGDPFREKNHLAGFTLLTITKISIHAVPGEPDIVDCHAQQDGGDSGAGENPPPGRCPLKYLMTFVVEPGSQAQQHPNQGYLQIKDRQEDETVAEWYVHECVDDEWKYHNGGSKPHKG
jgi:hypothetical protein